MLKTILFILTIAIVAFLLNHFYKQSSITIDSGYVSLQAKGKVFNIKYQTRKNISHRFTNVNVVVSEIGAEDEKLYLESAKVESLYEFTYTPEKMVQMLFDAKDTKVLFHINGLKAMRVVLNNSKIVNLFVSQNHPKELQFLYGMSDAIFIKAVKKLSKEEVSPSDALFSLSKPLATWSVKKLDLDGMVSSIDE